MSEERILVIQLRQLGDIMLTTPCFRAIKKARPKARLTFLSHAMGRLVIDDNPYVDEHFTYRDDWTWRQHWRLAKTLRERRFDLVLDLMNNPRSAFYALMTGGHERAAFASARRLAYTMTVSRPDGDDYIVRQKFKLLAACGFQPADERLTMPWEEADTRPMLKLLQLPAVKAAPLVVALSPTHRREARQWPLLRYSELADRLTKEWGAAVVWLWGPGEEGVVDEAMALCKEVTLKSPATTLRELAALIANTDLFVGNSNGPSHIAVAQDVPSLQLHGPTPGRSWCPNTSRHRFLQAATGAMSELSVLAVWDSVGAMRSEVLAKYVKGRPSPRLSWRQPPLLSL